MEAYAPFGDEKGFGENLLRERWLEMEIENPEEASRKSEMGREKGDAASRLDGSRGMLQKRTM